jgi:hypothetical protein
MTREEREREEAQCNDKRNDGQMQKNEQNLKTPAGRAGEAARQASQGGLIGVDGLHVSRLGLGLLGVVVALGVVALGYPAHSMEC